uniref:Uncharacterized protein n=1 Tax=Pavo cristatus TaxID=9049 RepID=A0A8C9FWW8_PAVCR
MAQLDGVAAGTVPSWHDMSIFGHCPAHDEFYLVVCNHCSQVVKPQAFQKHCGELGESRDVGGVTVGKGTDTGGGSICERGTGRDPGSGDWGIPLGREQRYGGLLSGKGAVMWGGPIRGSSDVRGIPSVERTEIWR